MFHMSIPSGHVDPNLSHFQYSFKKDIIISKLLKELRCLLSEF